MLANSTSSQVNPELRRNMIKSNFLSAPVTFLNAVRAVCWELISKEHSIVTTLIHRCRALLVRDLLFGWRFPKPIHLILSHLSLQHSTGICQLLLELLPELAACIFRCLSRSKCSSSVCCSCSRSSFNVQEQLRALWNQIVNIDCVKPWVIYLKSCLVYHQISRHVAVHSSVVTIDTRNEIRPACHLHVPTWWLTSSNSEWSCHKKIEFCIVSASRSYFVSKHRKLITPRSCCLYLMSITYTKRAQTRTHGHASTYQNNEVQVSHYRRSCIGKPRSCQEQRPQKSELFSFFGSTFMWTMQINRPSALKLCSRVVPSKVLRGLMDFASSDSSAVAFWPDLFLVNLMLKTSEVLLLPCQLWIFLGFLFFRKNVGDVKSTPMHRTKPHHIPKVAVPICRLSGFDQ